MLRLLSHLPLFPAVSASVIFVWLFDPDGGVADWLLGRLPGWLGGAGPWRLFWKVTYPLLKPIFLVLLLLSVIWDFGIFTQAYIVTGELGNRDEFNLGICAYDRAFTMPPAYGVASALALILTLILLLVTAGYVRASIKQGAIS